MAEDTETVVAPQDTAASEPVKIEDTLTPAEAEAGLESPPVDDGEEIEFDGEKYKVPKKLKDGFLMQADYTRKTQGLADERKGLENERTQFEQATKAHQAHLQDVGRVMMLNEQIAQLEKIDWQSLEANDPFAAQAKFREYTLAKGQRDGLIQQIQANEQKRSQEAQQSFAKRYSETNAALAKDIQGWNQELADNLRKFAVANGASEDDIRTLAVNAPLVKLLHKAYLGDQLVKERTAAAKTADEKPVPTPLVKVSGGGSKVSINPQVGPENMADFSKWLLKKTG